AERILRAREESLPAAARPFGADAGGPGIREAVEELRVEAPVAEQRAGDVQDELAAVVLVVAAFVVAAVVPHRGEVARVRVPVAVVVVRGDRALERIGRVVALHHLALPGQEWPTAEVVDGPPFQGEIRAVEEGARAVAGRVRTEEGGEPEERRDLVAEVPGARGARRVEEVPEVRDVGRHGRTAAD